MSSFYSFLVVFFGMGVAFFLQQFRIFSLFGVNPNLLLIGFLIIVFIRVPRWIVLGLLILFLLAVYLQASFWFFDSVTLFLLILIVMFTKKYLTGHPSVDFFLSLIFGTLLFYGIVGIIENVSIYGFGFREYSFSIPNFLIKEVIYNLFFGIIFWTFLHKKNLI